MKKFLLLLTPYLFFTGCTLTNLIARGTQNNKIIILDQLSLKYNSKNKIGFSEISDISYNSKTGKLYMLGDKGNLYEFSAKFNKKIEKLKYLNAFRLVDTKYKNRKIDSEGLTYNNRGELIVSFERVPRVSRLTKRGKIDKDYTIPKKLRKKSVYKTGNSIFESVTYHPKYGILVAAERPINRQPNQKQTIYSLDGKEWRFIAEKHKNSSVTAMEVMDDNNILVLERAYSGISNPFIVTLKKVFIEGCKPKKVCKSEVLGSFNSFDGWGINNFEGLAKVGKNRFVMVSDNHNKPYLETVLLYFKVK